MAVYDYNLLNSNLSYRKKNFDITYFGSYLYQGNRVQQLVFIPIFKYNKIHNKALKFISYAISLLKILVYTYKLSPNIIHIQWIRCYYLDILFLKLIKLKGIQVIYTAHNLLPHNDFNGRMFKKYRNYYNEVSHIIVHAKHSKEELINRFEVTSGKISIIPHGLLDLPCSETTVVSLIDKIKLKYNLSNKYVFSCLGFQSKYKGTDWLIQLWHEMEKLRNNSEVVLVLAGKFDSSLDCSLLDRLNNVVIVDRFLTDDEFVAFLRISNMILLPYKVISQSGVLLSAMYERKPVLVSNVGGLTEPFEIGKVGWCIGAPSYENLCNMISYIVENLDKIDQIKNNQKVWSEIRNYYSWTAISKKTFDLYNRLS
ncbi:glycosyltransferase family 4 protein [Mediterranea massiliensis]|uniref:glycosyltransferase family 4 protein n=1 Tax=Mediterranea massiliensis TaxID=1841865 RepID=UPI0025A46583|nr:glycosyltransferase family 4 protein [Mediterranea massiliensis]MDM8336359.1 glycosyltransferase family 4 protein [Mediterranea massiliensis]